MGVSTGWSQLGKIAFRLWQPFALAQWNIREGVWGISQGWQQEKKRWEDEQLKWILNPNKARRDAGGQQ